MKHICKAPNTRLIENSRSISRYSRYIPHPHAEEGGLVWDPGDSNQPHRVIPLTDCTFSANLTSLPSLRGSPTPVFLSTAIICERPGAVCEMTPRAWIEMGLMGGDPLILA